MILSLLPDFVTFICKRLMNSGHQAYVVGGALRERKGLAIHILLPLFRQLEYPKDPLGLHTAFSKPY